jgi:RNA polymerase sigma-70 factor (ECF subfamily)
MRDDVSTGRRDLLRRIQAQDQQAMGMLYDQLAPLVYTVLLRMLGQPADAEEVLLETFRQVWQGAASYDPLQGTVDGWVVTLARRQALRRLRGPARRSAAAPSRQPAPRDQPPGCVSPAPTTPESPCAAAQGRVVHAALAALPAEQRVALELAYYQGWSLAEMAQRLEQPLGTMQARVRLALRQLRKALHPYLGGRS